MEVEAKVGVNADAEVIVHDKDLRLVLLRVGRLALLLDRVSRLVNLLLVRVENHRPPAVEETSLTKFKNKTRVRVRIVWREVGFCKVYSVARMFLYLSSLISSASMRSRSRLMGCSCPL